MKKSNSTINQLVAILNDGAWHDGDQLGRTLGVSRASVWKMMAKLKQYALPLLALKGKGYCLTVPYYLLDQEKLSEAFFGSPITIHVVQSIPSTNDYFKQLPPVTDQSEITICIAEQQTAGRGRLARSWYSPYGQHLYMSCRVLLDKDISELGGLSLVAGLSISQMLAHFGITHEVGVKWPNDVLWQGKKLAGILVDVRAEAHGRCEVVIGMGINVNDTTDASAHVSQPVVSMADIAGHWYDRTVVAIKLIEQLVQDLQQFLQQGYVAFLPRWQAVDYLAGKEATLIQGNQMTMGTVLGVTEQGLLMLQQDDSTVKTFAAGEASLQKR
jgi:BirA family biotin operon repressor/biotin-[acetyl-CoA-carboxylase] ligase